MTRGIRQAELSGANKNRFNPVASPHIAVIISAIICLAAPTAARADPITDLPLPEKRPALQLTEIMVPAHWSEMEIAEARKKCAPILVAANAEFEILEPIRKGACGTAGPIKLSALGTTVRVKISPPASLNCQMVRALDHWLSEKVQPLAQEKFGAHVTEIKNIASYSCRHRYNDPRKKLSEHALANALDIAGLKLENGKYVSLLKHWGETKRHRQEMIATAIAAARAKTEAKARKEAKERQEAKAAIEKKAAENSTSETHIAVTPASANSNETWETIKTAVKADLPAPVPLDDQARFLRTLHEDACGIFGTVLGPEANEAHANHFHFDLAPRRRSAYCE